MLTRESGTVENMDHSDCSFKKKPSEMSNVMDKTFRKAIYNLPHNRNLQDLVYPEEQSYLCPMLEVS